MFWFSFKYRMKCILRDRRALIWTFLFPICLATFFYLGLSNIVSDENFKCDNFAIVEDEEYLKEESFKEAVTTVTTGEEALFIAVAVKDEEEAKLLMDKKEVLGYMMVKDHMPELVVAGEGISESIVKTFLDKYIHKNNVITHIMAQNPKAFSEGLGDDINNTEDYINNVPIGTVDMNLLTNYFYALLAMSCLFSGFMGQNEVMDIQGNLSKRGARVNTAPIHKMSLFLSGICAALVIQTVVFSLVLAYITLILKINLGNKIGMIILTGIWANCTGIAMGSFISIINQKSEDIKQGILILITVGGSFLAGLMYVDMKYIVATKCPIISYINPASLITDAFYSLSYYDTLDRYLVNMGILGVFTIVFCIGSYLVLRREKYANI